MQPHRARIMLAASLYADSHALPCAYPHNSDRRRALAATPGILGQPSVGSTNIAKQAGDQTYIGEQTLLMFDLLQRDAVFTIETARKQWCDYMHNRCSYVDEASAQSLATFSTRPHALKGSDSEDMAGAARIAPFVYCIDDLAALLIAVEAQTRLTHSHPTVIAATLFLTKLAYRVKHGQSSLAAIDAESAALPSTSPLAPLIDSAQQSEHTSAPDAIRALGNTGSVSSAFASTMLLLFRYREDFWECLSQNMLAGGQVAVRGALAGLILGASLDEMPRAFMALNNFSRILQSQPQVRAH
ncbi:ADP-ribosylglycohydrolase family protein [Alteromonas halophila]|uniref:ADP-ribosylglycohydrolase n=1 Tax=Alteromonas halophila TaxID=516698 RepID=A0A918JME9_9ALTE|nr:ADP-ribosylglycohydrolase family protein [Alteromonas halophila]GGW87223.1 ADP-ribosylglycohydrolase [Alteromonas halophila]